jgi:hypothetical protein
MRREEALHGLFDATAGLVLASCCVNTSTDRQGAEEKNRPALEGGFFSYQAF